MAQKVSDATMEKRLTTLDTAHDLMEQAARLICNEPAIPRAEQVEYAQMIRKWIEVFDRRAVRTARMREDVQNDTYVLLPIQTSADAHSR